MQQTQYKMLENLLRLLNYNCMQQTLYKMLKNLLCLDLCIKWYLMTVWLKMIVSVSKIVKIIA